MKLISLSQGKFAKVDDCDFEFLSKRKWYANGRHPRLYAISHYINSNGVRSSIRMHRLILDVSSEYEIDHINGDSLDNRRSNLRLCTHKENSWNRPKISKASSMYKGVMSRSGSTKLKWISRIMLNGKRIFLGRFSTQEEAARTYDAKARELFGEFARCNFPKE